MFFCCGGVEAVEEALPRRTEHFNLDALAGRRCFGPWLRYVAYTPTTHELRLSVLIVCDDSADFPSLSVTDCNSVNRVQAVKLDAYKGYGFFRFQFAVTLGSSPRTVKYKVELPGSQHSRARVDRECTIHVGGANAPWHWMFYSCNGFHDPKIDEEWGGIYHLWGDVRDQHTKKPFNLMVGGGDQVYNDQVFELPSLAEWPFIKDFQQAVNTPFTDTMRTEVEDFYFSHYVYHFSDGYYGEALATIPSINSWDDHDIFDGWGSYVDELQHCPVMRSVYEVARRFYLVFQQHTNAHLVKTTDADQFLGTQSALHTLSFIGSSVALVAPDTRSERMPGQVLPPRDWDLILDRVRQLPASVRHVILLVPIPIIYPEPPLEEAAKAANSAIGKVVMSSNKLRKTIKSFGGVGQGIIGAMDKVENSAAKFGMLEVLDDIQDGWTAGGHQEEAATVITRLLDAIGNRPIRASILAGDAHFSSITQLKIKGRDAWDPEVARKLITHVTSSAIGNMPPPKPIIELYAKFGLKPWDFNETYQASMVQICDTDWPGGHGVFAATRNWCEVSEERYNPEDPVIDDGHLTFTLRFEDPGYKANRALTLIHAHPQIVRCVGTN